MCVFVCAITLPGHWVPGSFGSQDDESNVVRGLLAPAQGGSADGKIAHVAHRSPRLLKVVGVGPGFVCFLVSRKAN